MKTAHADSGSHTATAQKLGSPLSGLNAVVAYPQSPRTLYKSNIHLHMIPVYKPYTLNPKDGTFQGVPLSCLIPSHPEANFSSFHPSALPGRSDSAVEDQGLDLCTKGQGSFNPKVLNPEFRREPF